MGLNKKLMKYVEQLLFRYPDLDQIKENIAAAYLEMEKCYINNGKLLIAGNGGSASDSGHIAGELMKGFRISRKVDMDFSRKLCDVDEVRGKELADRLEYALPALPLTVQEALSTAYINDVGSKGVFAQQLMGYGNSGDVFLGISTSGNSENVINAAVVAKAMGIRVVALTGRNGGELADFSDVVVNVPEEETYLIQELHVPIYHCWCLMLEERFFGMRSEIEGKREGYAKVQDSDNRHGQNGKNQVCGNEKAGAF